MAYIYIFSKTLAEKTMLIIPDLKVVVAYWKVKTPCHAHGECIN